MFKKIIIGVGVAIFFTGAFAQNQPLCKKLEYSISSTEKDMSSQLVDGLGDNSAPREAIRVTKISNLWASIQVSLTLMQMNKCQPYQKTINEGAYITSALKCKTAMIGRTGRDTIEECDQSKWERVYESPEQKN